MYALVKILHALVMPYEQIHTCANGCVLFSKEHEEAKHYPKCKSSKYVEVDSSYVTKKQLDIPMVVVVWWRRWCGGGGGGSRIRSGTTLIYIVSHMQYRPINTTGLNGSRLYW
jgi:hypothetical protein